MSESPSLSELRKRHQELDDQIAEEEKRPGSDDLYIRELKFEKLRIKDQIELRSGE